MAQYDKPSMYLELGRKQIITFDGFKPFVLFGMNHLIIDKNGYNKFTPYYAMAVLANSRPINKVISVSSLQQIAYSSPYYHNGLPLIIERSQSEIEEDITALFNKIDTANEFVEIINKMIVD